MPDTIILIIISTGLLSATITYFIRVYHEPYEFGRIQQAIFDAISIKEENKLTPTIRPNPDNKYIKALKKAQEQFNIIKRAYEDEKDFGEEQDIPLLINQGIADVRKVLININSNNKGEKSDV